MYVSIGSNLASTRAASSKVQANSPSNALCGSCPVSRRASWYWKPPRNRPMRGATTHVSSLKNNTDCTTTLKKNLDTCGCAPSLLRIIIILLHTNRALVILRITAGQSLSATYTTLPRYFKDGIISRLRPQRLPSSRITTMSQTFQCKKCTRTAVRSAIWPRHPSTGKGVDPTLSVNTILYVMGLFPLPYLQPYRSRPPFATTCWVWRCAASDPLVKFFPYSGHLTHYRRIFFKLMTCISCHQNNPPNILKDNSFIISLEVIPEKNKN